MSNRFFYIRLSIILLITLFILGVGVIVWQSQEKPIERNANADKWRIAN